MLNSNEIWIPIPEYENLYAVSNAGNIQNYRKTLKPHTMPKGYQSIKLIKNGVREGFLVHRLVAKVFCPNPLNKPDVNHIDGNKANNSASNLEWCTKSENMVHATNTGLLVPKGYATGFKKVTAVSNYHNVSWDKSRNMWVAAVYFNGVDKRKRFESEIDAALYVNTLLDYFGITDRPRNIIA